MLEFVNVAFMFEVVICHSCICSCCAFVLLACCPAAVESVMLPCCCCCYFSCHLNSCVGGCSFSWLEFAVQTHVGFPLANYVVIWRGCVHVLCCVCFPYVLALGFDTSVGLMGWLILWLGLGWARVAVNQTVVAFILLVLLGLGWGVSICVCVCVLPYAAPLCDVMCWLYRWVGCVFG